MPDRDVPFWWGTSYLLNDLFQGVDTILNSRKLARVTGVIFAVFVFNSICLYDIN